MCWAVGPEELLEQLSAGDIAELLSEPDWQSTGLRSPPGLGASLQAKQTPKANVSHRRRRQEKESEDTGWSEGASLSMRLLRAGIMSSFAAVCVLLLGQGGRS